MPPELLADATPVVARPRPLGEASRGWVAVAPPEAAAPASKAACSVLLTPAAPVAPVALTPVAPGGGGGPNRGGCYEAACSVLLTRPGFPGCWVGVQPPREAVGLGFAEGFEAQCVSSSRMIKLMGQMSRPRGAEGAEGTLAAAGLMAAGPAVPPAPAPPLSEPRGHPDLRALLHDEQWVSLRRMGEFSARTRKEVWAPDVTPGLVAQSSSVPDPAAAPCKGAR